MRQVKLIDQYVNNRKCVMKITDIDPCLIENNKGCQLWFNEVKH